MKRYSLVTILLLACSGQTSAPSASPSASAGAPDGSVWNVDASAPTDATVDPGPVDKAARCASNYGNILTAPFGRLDGTVHAILKPTDQQCDRPNSTHIVLQVKAQSGVYRMVVNVLSTGADPDVRFAALQNPLPAPAFAEGWHAGLLFDYVTTLEVHNAMFTAVPFDALVERVVSAINLDEEVSVYSSTSGGDSSHLVHRNAPNADGAIFLSPRSATPRVLLFHFSEQMF
jgi:hypothetical protein